MACVSYDLIDIDYSWFIMAHASKPMPSWLMSHGSRFVALASRLHGASPKLILLDDIMCASGPPHPPSRISGMAGTSITWAHICNKMHFDAFTGKNRLRVHYMLYAAINNENSGSIYDNLAGIHKESPRKKTSGRRHLRKSTWGWASGIICEHSCIWNHLGSSGIMWNHLESSGII